MKRPAFPSSPAAWCPFAFALAAAMVLCVPGQPGSSHAQTTPRRSVTFAVPRAGGPQGAVWDTLSALEQRQAWLTAESLATALVTELERARPTDSLRVARALLHAANGHIKQRRHIAGKGFAALERAIGMLARKAPAHDPLLTWAHMMGGTFYTEAGLPELALAHARNAVTRLGPGAPQDSALLAQSWLAQGTALSALGRLEDAGAAHETALAIRSAMDGPDSRTLVPPLSETGLLYSRIGNFERARALLMRAVRIAGKDSLARSDFLEGALSRLSTVENRAGNIAESLELALRAYSLARRASGEQSIQAARMRTMVAYRLQSLGDQAGAAFHLREVLPPMVQGLGASHPQTLNARLALVESLVALGDTSSVERELAEVRAGLAGQERLDNSNVTYTRQLTADYLRLLGQNAAARDTLDVGIRQERLRADPLGHRLAGLYARAFDGMDGAVDREAVLQMGLAVDRLKDSTSVRSTPEWLLVLIARAGAEARSGLRDPAWAHALEAEEAARSRLEYEIQALPDARALQLMQQLGAPCELLVALARPESADESSLAWDRLVRWRGLVRQEVARRRPPVFAGADSVVLAAHARWAKAQQRLGQLVVSGAARPEDPSTAERFKQARRDADEAERAYVHSTRGAVAPHEPATLARVLAALGEGQALVAFAMGSTGRGDSTIGAFVATANDRRPRWIALGSASRMSSLVRAWSDRLALPPASTQRARQEEAACRRLGSAVRTRVWDPIEPALGGAREVFLVPETPVSELPWLALPVGEGRYLAERPGVLAVLDSERELIAPPSGEGRLAKSGVLAVGDPDFERVADPGSAPALEALALAAPPSAGGLRSRQWPCQGDGRMALLPLPGSRPEVEQLVRDWPVAAGPSRLLLGDQAAEAQVKHLAPSSAVIHLATHGVVVQDACVEGSSGAVATRGVGGLAPVAARSSRARKPPRSAAEPPRQDRPWLGRQVWLALAGANRAPSTARDENEGLLTAEEVVTLDLRGAEWVVLSACHSGLAPAWAHEGVLGMRRAFHLSGARAVIASRWPVGDESTREWMERLYAARSRGAGAAAAVGEACRQTLAARRSSASSTHPFYWAAFSASGR